MFIMLLERESTVVVLIKTYDQVSVQVLLYQPYFMLLSIFSYENLERKHYVLTPRQDKMRFGYTMGALLLSLDKL